MNASVLTEGNFDGMFLATLIAEEQQRDDIDIRVVGGKSAIHSVARTLLAVNRIPVAVVIDADSPEPDVAMERQSSAEEVIGAAAIGIPFRVIVAVPELEILFFRRPELLHRVFGEAVNDHVMELAQLSPRRALEKLAPGKPLQNVRLDVLKEMDADDLHALRETDLIQELLGFIRIAVEHSTRSVVSGFSQ
jgi:hypothetical protein